MSSTEIGKSTQECLQKEMIRLSWIAVGYLATVPERGGGWGASSGYKAQARRDYSLYPQSKAFSSLHAYSVFIFTFSHSVILS